jgi:hypothetical protein
MFLISFRNKMRDRIWGRAETDDDGVSEVRDSFDETVENEKDGSAGESIKDRILGRLWKRGQKKEDDFNESRVTDSVQLENDDKAFSKTPKRGSSHKPIDEEKRKRLWEKKPAKINDEPEPKDLLTVQSENHKGEVAEPAQDDVDSLLKSAGEIREQEGEDSGELKGEGTIESEASKGECADEKEKPDLFADIFKQEVEDLDSPLEILIASLPEVEINELIDDTIEVKALIRQWHQNVMLK